MKKLGEAWRSLPASKAAKFAALAEKDKARYNDTLKRLGVVTKEEAKRMKKPSRPKSGYMLYCDDHRAEVAATLKDAMGQAFRYTEVMRTLGAKWKSLGASEKAKYNDKAAALKAAMV